MKDRTILFIHSVPGSGFDPDPQVTSKAGVLLVSPSRPGYADSPPLPADVVPSLPAVVERIAPTRPVDLVVGWSGGGHYALALAALRPELVGAVALLGTPAPDDAVPWIPDGLRPLTQAMRADPGNALAMVGPPLEGTAPSRDMVTAGPADESLLEADPQLASRLDDMLGRAFHQGSIGMATDLVAQHAVPWGFEPSDVRQPVFLYYGDADPIVSLDHARHWAAVLPRASLKNIEGEGHLVLRTAWRELVGARPRG